MTPLDRDSTNTTVVEADMETYNAAEVPEAQAGVKNMEAIASSWTKWGLIVAYCRYGVKS